MSQTAEASNTCHTDLNHPKKIRHKCARSSATERALSPYRGKNRINGIDSGLFESIVAKIGPPIKKKRVIDIDLACQMLKAGFSLNQVGRLYRLSGCTIRNRLREAGRYDDARSESGV